MEATTSFWNRTYQGNVVPDYFFNPSLEENQILVDELCTELLQGDLC